MRWSWGFVAVDAAHPDPSDWKIFTVEQDAKERELLNIIIIRHDDKRLATAVIPNPRIREKLFARLKAEGIGRGLDTVLKWEVPKAE